MKPIPLRWRIILALIILALGTTLALSLVTQHFLDRSRWVSVNPEMGQALNDALSLAKEGYDRRKALLGRAGEQLLNAPDLTQAFQARDPERLKPFLSQLGLLDHTLRFVFSGDGLSASMTERLRTGPLVLKEQDDLLNLVVPVRDQGDIVAALIVTEHLDKLLNVERGVQTYKHLEMIEEELRQDFLLAFLFAAAAVVLLASLIGVRVGLGITRPLYALIQGTRELARDNLDYRITAGRNDEVGQVVESFNQMAEDLKQNRRQRVEAEKIAAWREIARRLAHEIKNPLTPIQLTVQQMKDKYRGTDPIYQKLVDDCTEIVTEEVERLKALVQEFADFARMPSLSLARNDLNNLVLDAVRLYPELNIELDLDPSMPEMNLDVEQMRRVIINLIENGKDAAGDGATLDIRTHLTNETARLVVIDSGPGVPEADRERIFQPYVSTKETGMGLGLAVARTIVENHGGSVTVTDGPGVGAHFEISLPVAPEPVQRPEVRR